MAEETIHGEIINGMWTRTIPLLHAEGELLVAVQPNRGRMTDVVLCFSQRILVGNVTGFQQWYRIPWKRALQFAAALSSTDKDCARAQLEDGRASVLGQTYGPVKLELNPFTFSVAYLDPDNCETIAHTIARAVQVGLGSYKERKRTQ